MLFNIWVLWAKQKILNYASSLTINWHNTVKIGGSETVTKEFVGKVVTESFWESLFMVKSRPILNFEVESSNTEENNQF